MRSRDLLFSFGNITTFHFHLSSNMKFTLLIPFATLAISSSAESAIRGGTSTSFDSIDIEPSTVVYAAPVRSYGGQSSKDLWDEIAVRIFY